jgi:hypothetical protein
MTFDADTLYRLLPAIHRIRDTEQTPPGALKALLSAIADEFAVMEENLDQLYDDLFIETCADWAIPYIGDLIGYEPLHALGEARGLARAEVAHTLALRRRKGTAAVLEQLARDVTGWNARAVEFFQLLGATQYMNHARPHSRYAPDLRKWEPLARLGGAFDSTAHTVDVRNIETGRGRFNIPNIGLFLWRLEAYRHTRSPAVRVDDRRYLISPLGHPLPLFTNPQTEDEITHLADPINVPDPIRRRVMADRLPLYCATRPSAAGAVDNDDPSVALYVIGAEEVPRDAIVVCNLADDGAGWVHEAPAGKYAIDPELGRIAVAADLAVPASLATTYHYGFSADLGGGEYSRARADDAPGTTSLPVPSEHHATIAAALAALTGDGVVEITDSGRYEETLSVSVAPGGHVILRAAEQCRPTLILGGELAITGGLDSAFSLEGLLVSGGPLRVADADAGAASNDLARLRIAHATLVPGRALDSAGDPVAPAEASLAVEIADVAVEIDHAIVGALRVHEGSVVTANDSIVDATAADGMAYAAPDSAAAGGKLSLDACTVIGRLRAEAVGTISNSLLLARAGGGDTLPPVHVIRRQTGCVRFTWLPADSLTPRRYRCQPESTAHDDIPVPRFTTLRFGAAAYCQLARATADAIRRGADDESEMGAFHALFPAQREANLQIRLREFLRVGLAAGIFYET